MFQSATKEMGYPELDILLDTGVWVLRLQECRQILLHGLKDLQG